MGSTGFRLRPTPPSPYHEAGGAPPPVGQAYTPMFMNTEVPMAAEKAQKGKVTPQPMMPTQFGNGQVYYNHYGVPVGNIGSNNSNQQDALRKASALATSQWGRGTAGFFGF